MSPLQSTAAGWTLLAKATLDSVSGYRRIFNSGGWGDYGAYVYYGETQTLNLTTYTLHHTPYNTTPSPYTLHPTLHTLHPTPYTLYPTP